MESSTQIYAERIAERIDYDKLNDGQSVVIQKSLAVSIFTFLLPAIMTCLTSEEPSAATIHARVKEAHGRNPLGLRRRTARRIRGDAVQPITRPQSFILADALIAEALETPESETETYAASFA